MSGYFAREEELRQHDRIIRRFARRMTRSEADAEDAVQEAWLRSLQHPPLAERSIVRWLRVVVSRSALRTIGRERTRRLLLREVAHTDSAPSVPCQLDERGSRERAERLIARLDEPYRTVLKLRFLEDLTPGEIAVVLRRPEVTVRSQLKRGLDRLRTRMDGQRRLAGLAAALVHWWRRLGARPALAGLLVLGVVLVGASLSTPEERRAVEPVLALAPRLPAADLPETVDARTDVALVPAESRPVLEAGRPVELARPAFAQGLVHRRGIGVARAEVWGSRLVAPPTRLSDPALFLGRTDDQGRFRVEIPDVNTILWAEEVEEDAGGAERGRIGSQRYALLDQESGACASIDLELLETARLRGVVRDEGGEGVAGARVWRAAPHGGPRFGPEGVFQVGPDPSWTTTDDDGRFELPVEALGLQEVWVELDGTPAWWGEVGSEGELAIHLPRPATLEAIVVSPAGQPLADCEVQLRLFGRLPELSARTDGAGRVRFARVLPGHAALSVLPDLNGLSALRRVDLAPGENRDLGTVAVTGAASVTGKALRDGRPLAGWRVLTETAEPDGTLEMIECLTDADGAFEFKACRRKLHELYLLDPTDPIGLPWARLPGVRPGAKTVLDARPPSASLYGVTVGFASRPRLALRGSSLATAIHVPLPADGEFEQRLPPGIYTPVLILPGLGELPLPEIELAANEIRFLELAPPTTGALDVRLAVDGNPVAGATLVMTLEGAGLVSEFVAGSPAKTGLLDVAAGSLSVASLLPGTYRLTARSTALGLVRREVTVVAGQTTQLEMALESGNPVTIVFDAERPLHMGERLSVALSSAGLLLEQSVLFAETGSLRTEDVYELQHSLADGDYDLDVQSSCGLSGSLRFSVPGDSRLTLRLEDRPERATR